MELLLYLYLTRLCPGGEQEVVCACPWPLKDDTPVRNRNIETAACNEPRPSFLVKKDSIQPNERGERKPCVGGTYVMSATPEVRTRLHANLKSCIFFPPTAANERNLRFCSLLKRPAAAFPKSRFALTGAPTIYLDLSYLLRRPGQPIDHAMNLASLEYACLSGL